MATTLFDAKPYDPRKARQKRLRIATAISVLIVIAVVLWFNRYWPEEHRVDNFFAALKAKNYEAAYGVWFNDPNWKQHPQNHAQYTYGNFYLDWGPGGEWGLINSYKVVGAVTPKGGSSGVIVAVRVNERAQKCAIWVEKKDKTLSFSPVDVE